MLGIDLYGFFHIVTENTILKPRTKEKFYAFDVYQGLYHECCKNIKLGTFTIPYKELWDISFSLVDTICNVYLDEVFVSSFELVDLSNHTLQYDIDKESDIEWYRLRQAKQEYESYIMEHKSTLYDSQIKYSIERLVPGYPTYIKLIEKFERAEQLCYIDHISAEEYRLALKEIDSFISPIMNHIIQKHT
jgi:hypothetical protein